jgi:hypothetical protein
MEAEVDDFRRQGAERCNPVSTDAAEIPDRTIAAIVWGDRALRGRRTRLVTGRDGGVRFTARATKNTKG